MDQWIESTLTHLTLDEKALLLGGVDFGHTRAIERLGVPSIKMTDGPNGARGNPDGTATAVCFPVGTALAATWNVELLGEVGAALADEAKTKGAQILLGPTVNIHRSPLAGRNFECYSEDPHLTARIAVAYIRGLQARNVGACIKHFVCNDSEFERHSISSQVGERALREIYLAPFEAAVAEAEPWSVMAAYNRINGIFACANRRLLIDILKREWKFAGLVISDWLAVQDTVETASAGTDLEMPGPPRFYGRALAAAVQRGEVPESAVDDKVRRLLRVIWLSGRREQPEEIAEHAVDRPEHRALARRVAAEGMVLLKNEQATLPLAIAKLRTLAVIGPNARVGVIQGGGSSIVRPHYAVHPLAALRERCGERVNVIHAAGCRIDRYCPRPEAAFFQPLDDGRGLRIEYFDSDDLSGPVVASRTVRGVTWAWFDPLPGLSAPNRFSARWMGTIVPAHSGRYVFGLSAIGRCRMFIDGAAVLDNWSDPQPGELFFGRSSREVRAGVDLIVGKPAAVVIEYSSQGPGLAAIRFGVVPPEASDLMAEAVNAAASADAAIVIVGTDGDWETEGSDRVDMHLPGRQNELIERVAAANRNTVVVLNTGSPVTMDWRARVPAVVQAWFPGQEFGNALADVLFGDVDPGGRLPTTFPRRLQDNPAFINYPGENGEVVYGEGIFVGYRYYDTKEITPLFPFGHGLSYTTFAYSDAATAHLDGAVEVTVTVANVGERTGTEVVQLYVRDREASLARPDKELKAFAKIALRAGERTTVRFRFGQRAFAFYDPARANPKWIAEPGEFEFLIGSSSRNIHAVVPFALSETITADVSDVSS
ncbi:MAG: glycoside hydrolase family 3 C-terminal domain-containing protein [Deltaproteobacteria bacterium]|nr:glycoside hydrolase family 3 C-terminal domain-containing protein [Deltaproteobacteria bacterium]MBI3390995.1 glycoside hydrolase family 3 C-terminal domain-containing protein [Deltaproteobacteria bacterium]